MIGRKKENESIDTAPGPVSRKQTKPYPKRLFFIVLAVIAFSLFLILTGGSAINRKPSDNTAQELAEPRYTGSEPTLNVAEDMPPEMPEEMPEYLPDYELPASLPQPGPERPSKPARFVDRQWIEHQRMTHLSRSMVTDWPISSPGAAEAAQGAGQPAAMPGGTGGLKNYLDLLLAQQGGNGPSSSSASSQRDFFEKSMSAPGNLSSTRQPQRALYKIPAGTIIPCVMITGINSDLPGNVTAQVSENVYDFVNPYVCLIPQGSRVFGEYHSSIDFGQKRVQVRWTSITYPDGSTLNIEGMPGVDKAGYSGLHDKYYPHYGRMLTAAVLTSALTLLPDLVLDETTSSSSGGTTVVINTGSGNGSGNIKAEMAREAASAVGDMGKKFFDKALNAQPTVQIRPGTRINIQANVDVLFNQAWK